VVYFGAIGASNINEEHRNKSAFCENVFTDDNWTESI
jgi:hypothetical protein